MSWILCVICVLFFFFFKQKTAYEIMPSLVGSEMCIRDRDRGELFIAQTIDINGDSVPEALVDLQTGGAYTEDYAICERENGKLYVANFRDKYMLFSQKFFSKGASVQHEVKLSFAVS